MKSRCIAIMLLCAFASVAAGQISLTVYNDDLALVKDVRELALKKGTNDLKFGDVSAQIDPTSVHFQSLTAPDQVALLEQNYEYDLVNAPRMLEKYVDQPIRIFVQDDQVLEGTLLSASGGDIVLKIRDGGIRVIRSKAVEGMEFPDLPEGLITRPTLVWSVDCRRAGTHRTEVSYLTTGIGWHAEYVAVINEDDSVLDLSGWVSIDNRSGATYKDARLKLVAGAVHRVEDLVPMRTPRMALMAMKEDAGAPFEERSFFEYHLYTLTRPATVKDQQIKQLSLFPNAHVATKKIYSYDGARDEKKVKVKLEFENRKDAGLGLALPKGKVRVYKRDLDAALEFVGEDRIDHTPKGRNRAPDPRRRLRRCRRAQRDRASDDLQTGDGGNRADHPAQSQGGGDHRRGRRAPVGRLGDPGDYHGLSEEGRAHHRI
ncbi:MAG: DUF4139 domain-containing protein [Candidatus Latescibacterota bacterium]